ncbi:MAG: DUF4139 domain-containing protein [Tannerella sp.]|jgi:hypothetical protein|nr:DUF4139 domain-containing protein [Tannerella sp.]
MKTKVFYLMMVFLAGATVHGAAETKHTVHSTLDDVTLFFHGAELTHSAKALLTKGENEILIDGLSPVIDRNSLKIKVTGGAVISAYEFSVDYLSNENTSPAVRKLTDSIDFYRKKLQQTEVDTEINKQLIDLLQKGTAKNVSGSESGMSFDELVKTMDYFKTKFIELESISVENREKKAKYEAEIKRLKAQLNDEAVKNNRTAGVLKLVLNAPIAVSSQFTVSYFTSSAGWTPCYDIIIESTDRPIKIISKAKLHQVTGIEWHRVKLTLSTALPGNGKTAPLFSAWFLDFRRVSHLKSDAVMMQNAFSYSQRQVMPPPYAAEPIDASAELIETDDASPSYRYFVDGAEVDKRTYSSIDPALIASRTFMNREQMGDTWGEDVDGVWLVTLNSRMDDHVTTSENVMNVTYAIDIPYSIPGNGKEQNLELKEQEVSASYKYYCAPKLDTETYLLAEIAQPERLNLLNGKANITYEGTYIGEAVIDANTTLSTLTLTLGTDRRVSVKREKVQDFSSRKFIGSEVEQIFTYRLTVRNGQNKPVRMTLKDQYPVSSQKEIKVELLDRTTKPSFNVEDIGVLTWEEELQAGETKVYEISYSVKYPKNRNLNLP